MQCQHLTPDERRDAANAALALLKIKYPGWAFDINVEEWTDARGFPVWQADLKSPAPFGAPPRQS